MAMELSSDLVEEILSRLPAKSLALLRYTCKQWKTLIADPRFINKHSSHMRCREQQFTVFNNVFTKDSCSTVSCMGIDFNKHNDPCLDLQVLEYVSSTDPLVQNMYHCDGLLLLVMRSNLLVLNPLLKQARCIRGGCSFENMMDAYGLGYISNQSSSSTCNDYKMVSFRCAQVYNFFTRVEVYEFKSDSWKAFADRTFDGFFGSPLSNVCLRGTPYWIGYNKYDNKTISIQSFDFSKERFEPLFLPPSSFGSAQCKDLISLGIFREDQLSLLHKSRFADRIHIWVLMKKQQQHWNRLMTVAIPELSMLYKYPTYFIENNGKRVLSVHHFETGSISTYIA